MGINPLASGTKYNENLDQKLSLSATSQNYVISSTEKKSSHTVSLRALEKLSFLNIFSMATGSRFFKLILLSLLSILFQHIT